MPSDNTTPARFLRERDGREARVTNVELFFDLIYAFAVTQLSHRLIHDLSALSALQTLILWFAVWLGWQYTCWVTNWFDPERIQVRLLLFAVMLVAMVMSVVVAMICAEGLGLVVLQGLGRLDVGRAAVGGIAIGLLAMTLDRITQGLSKPARRKSALGVSLMGLFTRRRQEAAGLLIE